MIERNKGGAKLIRFTKYREVNTELTRIAREVLA